MLTNQSLSDIRKYVTSYTEQELQINAFREYLSSREISWNESDSLSQLAQLFDSSFLQKVSISFVAFML